MTFAEMKERADYVHAATLPRTMATATEALATALAAMDADPTVKQQASELAVYRAAQDRAAFLIMLSHKFSGEKRLLSLDEIRDTSPDGHLNVIKVLGRIAKQIEGWGDLQFLADYEVITHWVKLEREALDKATRHDTNFGGM